VTVKGLIKDIMTALVFFNIKKQENHLFREVKNLKALKNGLRNFRFQLTG